MFTITEEEYQEIVDLIARYCCPCPDRHGHCAEAECDVQMIYEIFWDHVERDEKNFDLELAAKECGMDFSDESLPFKE